jgi:hypothetical protein
MYIHKILVVLLRFFNRDRKSLGAIVADMFGELIGKL